MSDLIQARFLSPSAQIEVTQGQQVPTDIQWMPPGKHTIVATANGKPKEVSVIVDAAAAQRLNSQLQEMRSKAAAGPADLPYTDFNHSDAEASGRPLELRWGGEDPITGGIRANMDWTGPGETALRGRAYRRFSPQFLLDQAGQIAGIGLNLGGLVNQAAFKTIAPIAAKCGGAPTQNEKMDQAQQLAELTAKVTSLTSDLTELKAKQTSLPADVQALQARVTALTEANGSLVKARALDVVNAAVRDGKLPPQDTATHEKWVTLITVDAKNAELLQALPVNPALKDSRIVPGANGKDASNNAKPLAETFASEVKAKVAELKSVGDAIAVCASANPEGYKAWQPEAAKYPVK